MNLAVALLSGWCLTQVVPFDPFGETSPPAAAAVTEQPAAAETSAAVEPAAPAGPAEDSIERVEMPRPRPEAPVILESALKDAAQAHDGESITLLEAFQRAPGQSKQRIARAYWKLALALAADQFARSEQRDFANDAAWSPATNERTPEDAALLATAAATAAARANETRLMLTAAQLELSDAMGRIDAKLPLASDRPHTGAYRTKYERIFGVGHAPARLRQINRTIPLRAAGIDRRADSIRAAEEAWETSLVALGRGQADLVATLASHDALVRERRQFLDAVRDYNFDIAEYALAVGGEGLNEPTIVSMLIQPVPAATSEPTPANPQTFAPGENSASKPAVGDTAGKAADPKAQRTLRPADPAAVATATHYQDLAGEPSPKLTQLVAERLSTAPADEKEQVERLGLAAFLTRATAVERPAALAAYWRLAEQAGRKRVIAQQLGVLKGLQASATLPDDPAGKARLAGEIVALEADLADAGVQLEAAQGEAARVLALDDKALPVLPASLPHAGRYQAHLDAQPANVANNRKVRHAATLIAAIHPAIAGHAAALVATEQARAVEAQAVERGGKQLEATLDAARQERLKSLALLQRLTDYNLAIGEYVLAVLPANTPADQLARSLVLSP